MRIIEFGALAPRLSKQIPGLPEKYDRWADEIVDLNVMQILTDGETEKARRRLLKKIEQDYKKGKWSKS